MQMIRCQFLAKKRNDGTVWIAWQASEAALSQIDKAIGFELYAGTSLDEAKQLARFLNSNIKSLSLAA